MLRHWRACGSISRELSQLIGSKGRVYAFEPTPPMYLRLCEVAQNSLVPIFPFPFGLADNDGFRKLFFPSNPGKGGYAGLTALPGVGEGMYYECPFYKLDTILSRYSLRAPPHCTTEPTWLKCSQDSIHR